MGDITLHCLIIPRGQFNSLTRDETTVTVEISINATVNELQTAIQSKLRPPLNNIPLDVRQIHPSSINEKRMQSQALISDYFSGDPPKNYYHITVYPQ